MTTVWKAILDAERKQSIMMPKGAKFLAFQVQGGIAAMWFLVDSDAPLEKKTYYIYGTGHDIQNVEKLEYRGTFQVQGGAIVLHVFEEKQSVLQIV